MLKRLKVSNYRSIAPDTTIQLERLTAFVGQNGSGKSNVVDVIRFLSDIMTIGLEGAVTKRHGIQAVRRWSSGHPVNVDIEVEIEDQDWSATYAFVLAGHKTHEYVVKSETASVTNPDGVTHEFRAEGGVWVDGPSDIRPRLSPLTLGLPLVAGDHRFQRLGEALQQSAIYTIFPDTLREPQKYDPKKPMEQHGANWTSILKDQDSDSWRSELVAALGQLTGDIDDVALKQVGGYLLVRFRHGTSGKSHRPKWFDTAQESDGTLRTAGIVTALLQNPALAVVGIEEPELTIHPGAMGLIFDFISQASARSQVLITTHSPELLDNLGDHQVRVVQRDDGLTRVAGMDARQREAVRNRLLSLGDVLRTEGIKPQLDLFPGDGNG